MVPATTGIPADGWFESVVVREVDADLFELRWRDYDGPNFMRRRDHLALLPPALATRV